MSDIMLSLTIIYSTAFSKIGKINSFYIIIYESLFQLGQLLQELHCIGHFGHAHG